MSDFGFFKPMIHTVLQGMISIGLMSRLLSPKTPRPLYCQKTLRIAISIVNTKKLEIIIFGHLTIGSYT